MWMVKRPFCIIVDSELPKFKTPIVAYIVQNSPPPISSLLLRFLIFFTFPSTWHHFWIDAYQQTQGNSLFFNILSLVIPCPTFAFCIIGPSFLSRSNGTVTDINSLAPGRKWLGNFRSFFRCAQQSYGSLSRHCASEWRPFSPTPFAHYCQRL
jgi:hypothetical protein